jgi:hypothetical protein
VDVTSVTGQEAGSMCDEKRRQLSTRICVTAAAGIGDMCRSYGVSVSGFMDAFGHLLGDMATMSEDDLGEAAPTILLAVLHGREIDHERRGFQK